jgi:hypothetical protein
VGANGAEKFRFFPPFRGIKTNNQPILGNYQNVAGSTSADPVLLRCQEYNPFNLG